MIYLVNEKNMGESGFEKPWNKFVLYSTRGF